MSNARLTVLVDGRSLVGERTGIGVHTAELAGRLGVEPPPIIASHAAIDDRFAITHCRFDVRSAPLGVYWQQVHLPAAARGHAADVLWGPHGTLPLRLDVPAVVSVHDLTSITMAHRHRFRTILSFNAFIAPSLQNAARIAAVSRMAADEVIRGFGVPARKVSVVPNGVDEFFSPGRDDEADAVVRSLLPFDVDTEPFVLYVGTLEPRKGVADLLQAWRSLSPRPRLVLCGSKGWGRLDHELAKRDGVMVTGFVQRGVLRELYRRARLFVYPSRYEGFGLPPLEAMACGTPVIAAAGGAIPEVVGDAAMLVEPGNPRELAAAIRELSGSASRRLDLISRGLLRAKQFRWETSAALMTELLVAAAGR